MERSLRLGIAQQAPLTLLGLARAEVGQLERHERPEWPVAPHVWLSVRYRGRCDMVGTVCNQKVTGSAPSVVSGTTVSTGGHIARQVIAHEIQSHRVCLSYSVARYSSQ